MSRTLRFTGAEVVCECYATDLRRRPIGAEAQVADGELTLELPEVPVSVQVLLAVPGYGRTWATADAGGAGYETSAILPLIEELAISRLRRCERRLIETNLEEPPDDHFEAAWDLYDLGRTMDSLRMGLLAGEDLEYAAAQFAMEVRDPEAQPPPYIASTLFGERRDGHSIGVGDDWDASGAAPDFLHTRDRWELMANLCDGTTLPNFWRRVEFSRGTQCWGPVDQILDFCEDRGLAAKSFSIFWGGIGGMPPWFRDLPYAEKLKALENWTTEIVNRLRGRVCCWEIANEMHDWGFANRLPQLTHDQTFEVVRLTSDLVGSLDPGTPRIVNHCCPWGDYAAQAGQWSPLTFLDDLVETGIEFEGLGVQMYNPGRDLMECIGLLDQYAEFGKPIWITEMGIPSSNTAPGRVETGQIDSEVGWRGPWEPESQAEWLEMFYAMAISRPYLRSITYWDLDDEHAFIPGAGLLDLDGQPKEAYLRLLELCQGYGVGGPAEDVLG